jgi:hypothetical protein
MPSVKPSFPAFRRGHPLAQGLVGCWACDEGSGKSVYDLSPNTNNGSISATGGPIWAADQSGWSLSYNGSSGVITTTAPAPVTGTAAFTAASWLKTSTTSTNNGAYSWGGSGTGASFLASVENGKVVVRCTGCTGSWGSTGTYDDGNWHHVVLTFPASGTMSSVNCYADGVLLSGTYTGGSTALNLGTTTGVTLGKNGVGGSQYFNGLIDSLFLWNRVLSQSEIAQLYEDTYALLRRPRTILKSGAVRGLPRNLISLPPLSPVWLE